MHPLRRSATALLVGVAATTTLAVADAPSPATPDTDAQHAVTALLSGSATRAREAVPADFAATQGYAPVLEGDSITRADGSCSSPVPLPDVFERACRQHDYGYDLLRYADGAGGALPAKARTQLDGQFEEEALRSCEHTDAAEQAHCTRWAHIAGTFVQANSWRQHNSVPVPDDALSVATGGAAALALLSGGSLLTGLVRAVGTGAYRRPAGLAWPVAA